MSDTENNTDKIAKSTPDNAPTMKKNSNPEVTDKSVSKSNIVIPLVLLLVSAIVIVATFYEEEYKQLIAQDAPSLDVAADSEEISQDVVTAGSATATAEITAEATTEITTDNPETSIVASNPHSGIAEPAAKNVKTVALARSEENSTQIQPGYGAPYRNDPYTNKQPYEQARQNAVRRAQEQAEKRNKAMQQHRLAYEKEMQERRQYYEAAKKSAMKAQQERRSRIAEAQKAVYQRVEQNRTETRQKLQEMHNQISEMHNEIHQILRDSHVNHMPDTPDQIQSPSVEQM